MVSYSESQWPHLRDLYTRVVKDFVDGDDSEAVFRARMSGLGYRGEALTTEINLALMTKAERHPVKPSQYGVMVMGHGSEPVFLRFISEDAAENAARLLRKQPNVIGAFAGKQVTN